MKNKISLAVVSYVLIVLSFLFVSMSAHAKEYPRNPDRFPSLGLNASTSRLSGARTHINSPGSTMVQGQDDSGTIDNESFGADFRLPINNGVTLNVSWDRVSYNSSLTRTGNIYEANDNFDGNRFGLGLRVYFNK